MPVQTDAQKLRQHVHAVQAAVDAIADGNINQAVLACHGYSGFAAQLGKRIEPCAPAAPQDQAENVLHQGTLFEPPAITATAPRSECRLCYHSTPATKSIWPNRRLATAPGSVIMNFLTWRPFILSLDRAISS